MTDENQDALDSIETARHAADDHIHGYDYHIYLTIREALDLAEDRIESLTKRVAELKELALLMQAKARMNDGQEPIEVDLEDE